MKRRGVLGGIFSTPFISGAKAPEVVAKGYITPNPIPDSGWTTMETYSAYDETKNNAETTRKTLNRLRHLAKERPSWWIHDIKNNFISPYENSIQHFRSWSPAFKAQKITELQIERHINYRIKNAEENLNRQNWLLSMGDKLEEWLNTHVI